MSVNLYETPNTVKDTVMVSYKMSVEKFLRKSIYIITHHFKDRNKGQHTYNRHF